jgi:polysaccharide export outer membrane protein
MERFYKRVVFAVCLVGVLALPGVGAQEPTQVPVPQETKPPVGEAKPSTEEAKPVDEFAPAVPAVAAPIDPRSYRIGTEDVVMIRVWREKELSGLYRVRPDGQISMPLTGDIPADGATPQELKGRVVAALGKFMNDPEVTLDVQQVNSKKFFLTGEVGRPGAYPLVNKMTVLEALSNAGGLRDFANGKKIVIMRGEERLKFNYKDVIRGKNLEQNLALQPGDHIIVP